MLVAEELGALLGQPLNPHREENPVKCPLHNDRVASMSINLRKGAWQCFACGKGGSLQTLARFLGGELDRTELTLNSVSVEPEPEPVDFASKFETMIPLTPVTAEGITYRRERGLRFETLEAFSIRHDARGNLVMPYFDGDRVAALRYRGSATKFYESGSERTIYNLNEVRGSKRVVLCEGESDTHSVWQVLAGTGIAVGGVPGANASVERWEVWSLDLMWAEKVYLAFDNDDAGNKGAERAIEVLGERAARLRPPEEYNDWNEAIRAGKTPDLVY